MAREKYQIRNLVIILCFLISSYFWKMMNFRARYLSGLIHKLDNKDYKDNQKEASNDYVWGAWLIFACIIKSIEHCE